MDRFIFNIQIVGGNLADFDDNQHNWYCIKIKNSSFFSLRVNFTDIKSSTLRRKSNQRNSNTGKPVYNDYPETLLNLRSLLIGGRCSEVAFCYAN